MCHAWICPSRPASAATAMRNTSTTSRMTCTQASSRRALFFSCIAVTPVAVLLHEATPAQAAGSAEQAQTLLEPACASCVGYIDGTLGSCSAVDVPCSSSYDDRPAFFVAPWQYDGSTQAAMQHLVSTLQDCGAQVLQQTADYVYAVYQNSPSSSLDLEFVFAPNDTTVALRAAQHTETSTASSDSADPAQSAAASFQSPVNALVSWLSQTGLTRGQPSQVLEDLRRQLGWEEVPILRNRQQPFLFESPLDSFGPVPPPVPDYSRDLMDF